MRGRAEAVPAGVKGLVLPTCPPLHYRIHPAAWSRERLGLLLGFIGMAIFGRTLPATRIAVSHHRVHHAANPEYLDRNYGGIFIVFDRLFGTLVSERDDIPCRYGLVTPLRSNNPVIIAFHEWAALAHDLWQARSWRERLICLIGPPDRDLTTPARPRRSLPNFQAPFEVLSGHSYLAICDQTRPGTRSGGLRKPDKLPDRAASPPGDKKQCRLCPSVLPARPRKLDIVELLFGES
jgi:hypothetical protein